MSEAVASPCVRECRLNDDQVCTGCYRTIEEITGWGSRGEQEKALILANCKARRAAQGAPA